MDIKVEEYIFELPQTRTRPGLTACRLRPRDIDRAKELLTEYKDLKKAMTSKSISKHKG